MLMGLMDKQLVPVQEEYEDSFSQDTSFDAYQEVLYLSSTRSYWERNADHNSPQARYKSPCAHQMLLSTDGACDVHSWMW